MSTKAQRLAQQLGDLVVGVFRLNGELLAEGDALTRDLGITSARWQVLGALELAGRPLTVSQIARNMGLARQSVARIASELEAGEFVELRENPDHRTARLVVATPKGHRAFQAAMRRQSQWGMQVCSAAGVAEKELRDAISLLERLRGALSTRTK